MHRELLMLRIEVVILRDSGQLFADLKFSARAAKDTSSLVGEPIYQLSPLAPQFTDTDSIGLYRRVSRERYFPRDFGALEAAGIVIQRPTPV